MTQQFQPLALDLVLPWQPDQAQEEKFKKIVKRIAIPLLLLFIVVPFLPVPDFLGDEYEERVVKTKVMLEPKIIETPPPPEKKQEEVRRPPKEVKKSEPKPNALPAPPAPASAVAQKPTDADTRKSLAASQGLANLSNQLGALRDKLDITKLQNKNVSDSKTGSVMQSERQVLGEDKAMQRSNGVVVDDNMMRNQGTKLASHTTMAVDGVIVDGADYVDPSASTQYGTYQAGRRDSESIRLLLELAKTRNGFRDGGPRPSPE